MFHNKSHCNSIDWLDSSLMVWNIRPWSQFRSFDYKVRASSMPPPLKVFSIKMVSWMLKLRLEIKSWKHEWISEFKSLIAFWQFVIEKRKLYFESFICASQKKLLSIDAIVEAASFQEAKSKLTNNKCEAWSKKCFLSVKGAGEEAFFKWNS